VKPPFLRFCFRLDDRDACGQTGSARKQRLSRREKEFQRPRRFRRPYYSRIPGFPQQNAGKASFSFSNPPGHGLTPPKQGNDTENKRIPGGFAKLDIKLY
jgi:hypothetical protein